MNENNLHFYLNKSNKVYSWKYYQPFVQNMNISKKNKFWFYGIFYQNVQQMMNRWMSEKNLNEVADKSLWWFAYTCNTLREGYCVSIHYRI